MTHLCTPRTSSLPSATGLLSRFLGTFSRLRLAVTAITAFFLTAFASAAVMEFNIPAQPAHTALQVFVKQSGCEALFMQDELAKVQASEVKGRFEPADAITRLLTGTGFSARQTGPKNFLIKKVAPETTTGSVRGSLTGEGGKGVANVLVTIKETAQSAETDKYGVFAFPKVAAGTYVLVASAPGYQTMHITDVQVKAGRELTLGKEDMRKAQDGLLALEPFVVHADTVEQLEKFEVTGTKQKPFSDRNVDIPRGIDDVQAYYIFDAKTIDQSGATSVEDFLKQRLTMNTTAQSNAQLYVGASSPGNTSSINLRGLGTNETLILVNGRRMAGVFYAGINATAVMGQPDINGLPLAAIDHIEVLPSSASAIYGGSAIGGVVNIVLKKKYQGGEIKYTYANTADTDAPTRTTDLTYGFSLEGGKTQVLLTAHYSDSKPLLNQDREFLIKRGVSAILANAPKILYGGTLGGFPPFPGATTNIVNPFGNLVLKDGTSLGSGITFIPAGTSATTPLATLNAGLLANAGTYNLNLAPGTTKYGLQGALGSATRTKSFMATIQRQMASWLDAFAEVSTTTNAAFSVTNPIGSFSNLPASAPGNPFQNAVYGNFPSAMPVSVTGTSYSRTITGGFTAKLPGDWVAELDYTWSKNTFKSRGALVSTGLSQDLANGTLNPFVDTIANPPLNLDRYLSPTYSNGTSTVEDIALRAAGQLGNWRGLSPRLAMAAEHRKEGNGTGVADIFDAYVPTNSSRVVSFPQHQTDNSLYSELTIPLIAPKWKGPFLHSLEVQLAGRIDKYSVETGTTSASYRGSPLAFTSYSPTPPNGVPYHASTSYDSDTWTAGIKYSPLEDLTVRVSRAIAFLPPTYSQLLPNPIIQMAPNSGINDPVTGRSNYTGYNVINGGNPNLKPQNDKNWDAGIIFERKTGLLAGLRVNLEYYNISQYGFITAPTAQQVVSDPSFAGRVTRDPATQFITQLDLSNINATVFKTSGWDLSVNYRKPTSVGTFDLFAMGSMIRDERRQLSLSSPLIDYAGYPGLSGEAKGKANGSLNWQFQHWTLGWTTTWFSSYRLQGGPGSGSPTPTAISPALAQGRPTVPSQMYHQFVVAYAFADGLPENQKPESSSVSRRLLANLTVQLGLANVFDTMPPMDVSPGNAPYYYSPYGDPRMRNYWISIKKAF